MPDFIHPRDEIIQTIERIYRYRMTTISSGNLSIREDNGDVWISPARVDKGNLSRSDIVCVKSDGTFAGIHRPSSEYPFHRAVYTARPEIRAVIHAHPSALVAFSICRQVPNMRLFFQARDVCGQTGFAPYALPGSRQLAENIAKPFCSGCNCVILENHGVVVGGQSLTQAFQRLEAFEFAAKTLIRGRQLGEIHFPAQARFADAQPLPVQLERFNHSSASSQERDLRRQLGVMVRRGCRQRLLLSTEGSFSARLDDDSFLITPSEKDRELLTIDDFVLVRRNQCEAEKNPSHTTLAHRAIYRRHRSIQAIVFAHPVNATAFSITQSTLDPRTIPESYIFLRDITVVPRGIQYHEGNEIAEYVSPSSPAAILYNDGVLVTGSDILDAFDRLEVLEFTAEAIINSKSIGDIAPIADEVIAELKGAFPGNA